MSTNPSPSDVSCSGISGNQQSSGASSSDQIAPLSRLSTGAPYSSTHPPAMSAAAAAAFPLQAATGNAMNGDETNSSSRRTSRFFDSPQSSPSFPSAVISAAAAAAQAINSSRSSPNAKASSDLQAAVISLALAANSNTSTQSDMHRYDHQDPSTLPSQAVTDLFLLSERHPELLKSHPSLTSVFRRRSSTILPSYLSELSAADGGQDILEKNEHSLPQSLVSALEVINTRNCGQSDISGLPPASPTPINYPRTGRDDSGKDQYGRDIDPYRFSQVTPSAHPKQSRQFSNTSPGTYERNYALGYREPQRPELIPGVYTAHNPYVRSTAKTTLSPTTNTTITDCAAPLCRSPSPLSCSSLSNSATPHLNISPAAQHDRHRSMLQDPGDPTTKSGSSYASARTGCLSEHDIKAEYAMSGSYADEPNRKREQRLIKNREAARECRRKKKEYVKCLESRVSVLESQNQQLIEELQKVKALCFNELCGLGLNSSTAACAAAVLAAVTSVSGTYSVPSSSTAMKSSPSDLGVRPADHGSLEHTSPVSDERRLDSSAACRNRTRRRSSTKFKSEPESLISPTIPSQYQNEYMNEVDSSASLIHPIVPPDSNQKQNGSRHFRDVPCRSAECTSAGVSPNSYDSVVATLDAFRHRNQVTPTVSDTDAKRLEEPCYTSYSPPITQSVSRPSTYFHHPQYAVKRVYQRLTVNTEDPNTYPTSAELNSVNPSAGIPAKSSRSGNAVADAAVILAAAAAMVAESESSAKVEPQLSS